MRMQPKRRNKNRLRALRLLLPVVIALAVAPWSVPLRAQAAAGDLDSTFGIAGLVTTDFLSGSFVVEDIATAVVIQPDGKFVVAGYTYNASTNPEPYEVAVARYNPDGSLDSSFGSGGLVITDLGSAGDAASAVAIEPGGKILVGGTTYALRGGEPTQDFAIVRYNPDGSLDPSFGVGGMVKTDINGGSEWIKAIVIQPDGKILAGGASYQFATLNDFALARYDKNGNLDPSFGGNGLVMTDFGGGQREYLEAMAMQPDGKIVVAGETYTDTSSHDFALARYDADGSLDPSFGSGGMVRTDFGGFDIATCVALQDGGKIVAAGSRFTVNSPATFAIARYDTDGNLDPSFGADGFVTGPLRGTAYSVVARPGGGLYVAGGADYEFALASYEDNGSLDTSFGVSGIVTTSFGSAYAEAHGLALQPDGKIVAVGSASLPGTGFDFAVARYLGTPATPQAAIQLLLSCVSGFANQGVLNHGQANGLMAKLRAASESLDKGNNHAAANQLRAFINQVNAFISSGKLPSAQADTLIQGANNVITSLSR